MNKGFIRLGLKTMQVLFLIPALCFCRPAMGHGKITIVVTPTFNGQPLQLDNARYADEHGDSLSISLFRFYITNLKLLSSTVSVPDTNSHLIDASETATTTFTIDAPAGSYTALQFVAGVDSATNTSGANGGDLDPVKGMYWAWNSGYIMAKLEGTSKVCKTLHHAFEFHIGGYMPPCNTARTVTLTLPHAAIVTDGGNTIIKINADAAAWFRHGIDLAKTNSILIPGAQAMMMADNYAQMFSVIE